MSTDTDRSLAERLSAVETTLDALNGRMNRLDERMENRFDTLDRRIDDRFDTLRSDIDDVDTKIDSESRAIRQDLHRSMYRLFAAMTLVFVIVSVVVQLAL